MADRTSEVNISNTSNIKINPATEDKQDSIITELQKLIGFEIPEYDYIALTYVAAWNGVWEIETVIYKTGGSWWTTVATLTLAYDANNKLSTITKT